MGKRQEPAVGTEAHRTREQLARKLFKEWTGVTDGEMLAALWHNLCTEDRERWFDLAEDAQRTGSQ